MGLLSRLFGFDKYEEEEKKRRHREIEQDLKGYTYWDPEHGYVWVPPSKEKFEDQRFFDNT